MHKPFTSIVENIQRYNTFTIYSHVSPDGDALGSAAALFCILKKLGKTAVWLGDDRVPGNLTGFAGIQALQAAKGNKEEVMQCAIAADCADLARLGEFGENFMRHPVRLVIDHHKTNPGFGGVNWLSEYPATGVMVFRLLEALSLPLCPELAELLYIAIVTDTGRFIHDGTNEEVMHIVAQLYGTGIPVSHIVKQIFSLSTPGRIRLMGAAFSSLTQTCKGKASFFVLTEKDMLLAPADTDTDGVVNYALDIHGTEVGAFIKYKPDGYRVSLRAASPACDVSAIAASYGGGGHRMAAGCTIKEEPEKIIALLTESIQKELEKGGA